MVQSLQRSNPFRVAFDSPELLEVQRFGFNNFLKDGIATELSKISPIKIEKGDISIELLIDGANFQLISPDDNPRDCILKMKTYSCKLYVEGTVIWKTIWGDILYQTKPEWVLLGHLPIMTKRGHFIINGSPRVIVHQVVRSPGIYFQEIIETRPKLKKSKKSKSLVYKNTKKRIRFYGDIIPRRGVWVRLQLTHKGRIEAKLKKGKKISAQALQRCLEVIEKEEYLLSLTSMNGEASTTFRKKSLSNNFFPTINNFFSLENNKNSLHLRNISFGDEKRSPREKQFAFGKIFELGKKWSYNKVKCNQLVLRKGKKVFAHSTISADTENFSNISTHVDNSSLSIDWCVKPFETTYFYYGFQKFAFGNPKVLALPRTREAFRTAVLHRKKRELRISQAIEYSLFSVAEKVGLWPSNRVKPNLFKIDRYVSSSQTQYLFQEKRFRPIPTEELTESWQSVLDLFRRNRWPTVNKEIFQADDKSGFTKKGDNSNQFYENYLFLHKKERNKECIAEEKAFSDTYDKLYRTAEDKEEEQWASKRKNRAFVKTVLADQTLKRQKCSKNLFSTFKVGSQYDLSDLGREKINTKLGIYVNVNQLTSSDINAASNWLNKLRKGEKSIDDIDHSQNRRIRTSGELLQTQFENGIERLKKVTWNKLKEVLTLQSNEKYPFAKRKRVPLPDVQPSPNEKNNTLTENGEVLVSSVKKPSQQKLKDLSNSLLPFNSSLPKESFLKKEDPKYKSFSEGGYLFAFSTFPEVGYLLQSGVPSSVFTPTSKKFENAKNSKIRKGNPDQSKSKRSSTNINNLYQTESDQSSRKPYQGVPYQSGIDRKDKGKYTINWVNKEKEVIEQFIKEKAISIKDLLNTKAINGALREFFGSNPLSQYMDQSNPLAEITHKRRISSLGVGGVSRESAGMAIRGIHPTHYGRICPIETPEGKNAGLVNSLAFYAKIDEKGFIKTPYYKVVKGQVQEELGFAFFSAKEEGASTLNIAPSDLQQSWNNVLKTSSVPVRVADNLLDLFKKINLYQVDCIGISPIQMISVATSLIPFLEHNDANRALMGSNMQRQAVPLMIPERPLVGTGLESLVVAESGHLKQSKLTGFVSYVTAEKIVVEEVASLFPADNLYQKSSNTTKTSYKEPKYSSEKAYQLPCQINLLEYLRGGLTRLNLKLLNLFLQKIEPTTEKLENALRLKDNSIRAFSTYSVKKINRLQKVNKWPLWGYKSPSSTLIKNSFKVGVLKKKEGIKKTQQYQLMPVSHRLKSFDRSNQDTSLTERALVNQGDWVQKGDLLTDCSASDRGELAVGKNILIAYTPWEGYNFEDAIVISERLVREDVYTSIHIERYDFNAQDLKEKSEWFTNDLPGISSQSVNHLDESGLPKIGSFVEEGDILVGKIQYSNKKPTTPHERLLCDILGEKNFSARDLSLYVPKGVHARVIKHTVIASFDQKSDKKSALKSGSPKVVHIFLAEKRRIQVGDKMSGRHGNKGVIATILPRQDMPYLADGTPIDILLNPLGVPSRMNVGQVFECLLGLAGSYLAQHFKITPFDELYGVEASQSLIYLKLYQARLQSGQNWLFQVDFPGKTRLIDGRSGLSFDQWVTVGKAYILKLIHMVNDKIHARDTGPYALVTQQPLRGRAHQGGQRLGEMEVWALQAFGAAYTLQELLTKKSDDVHGRKEILPAILPRPATLLDVIDPSSRIEENKFILGHPEIFKVLICELQALCLDVGVYSLQPQAFQRIFLSVVQSA